MSICAMSAATDGGALVADGVALAVGEATTTAEAAGADVAGGLVPAQAASVRQLSVAQADATNEATRATTSAARIALFNATS
jgi:hypothetical protein